MKEYIERAEVKRQLRIWIQKAEEVMEHEAANCFRDCIYLIDQIPAVDVVEVVRCKDCANSRPIDKERWHETTFYEECVWCQWFDTGMLPDEYCSYGKRKMD